MWGLIALGAVGTSRRGGPNGCLSKALIGLRRVDMQVMELNALSLPYLYVVGQKGTRFTYTRGVVDPHAPLAATLVGAFGFESGAKWSKPTEQ